MNNILCVMALPFSLLQQYITWVEKETFNEVTKQRYGSVHPWPLNWILTWQKRQRVLKRLNVLGWLKKTVDEVSYWHCKYVFYVLKKSSFFIQQIHLIFVIIKICINYVMI